MKENYSLGQVVRSKAGRDKGRFMIVVGFEGDEFVLLSDGTLRRADKPKKKKFKHIAKTNTVCLSVAEKLAEGRAANALIKNALKDFNNPEETEGEDF